MDIASRASLSVSLQHEVYKGPIAAESLSLFVHRFQMSARRAMAEAAKRAKGGHGEVAELNRVSYEQGTCNEKESALCILAVMDGKPTSQQTDVLSQLGTTRLCPLYRYIYIYIYMYVCIKGVC